jgi:hypothetical protein
MAHAGSLTICVAREFRVRCSVFGRNREDAKCAKGADPARSESNRSPLSAFARSLAYASGYDSWVLCTLHWLFAWCAHRAVRTVAGTPGGCFRCAHRVFRTKSKCRVEETISGQLSAVSRKDAYRQGAKSAKEWTLVSDADFRFPTSDWWPAPQAVRS